MPGAESADQRSGRTDGPRSGSIEKLTDRSAGVRHLFTVCEQDPARLEVGQRRNDRRLSPESAVKADGPKSRPPSVLPTTSPIRRSAAASCSKLR